MALRCALTLLLALGAGFADTLTPKDGRKIEGAYLGGDSRQIRVAVGVIGAIAGGGAIQVLTRGQRVRIPVRL